MFDWVKAKARRIMMHRRGVRDGGCGHMIPHRLSIEDLHPSNIIYNFIPSVPEALETLFRSAVSIVRQEAL